MRISNWPRGEAVTLTGIFENAPRKLPAHTGQSLWCTRTHVSCLYLIVSGDQPALEYLQQLHQLGHLRPLPGGRGRAVATSAPVLSYTGAPPLPGTLPCPWARPPGLPFLYFTSLPVENSRRRCPQRMAAAQPTRSKSRLLLTAGAGRRANRQKLDAQQILVGLRNYMLLAKEERRGDRRRVSCASKLPVIQAVATSMLTGDEPWWLQG